MQAGLNLRSRLFEDFFELVFYWLSTKSNHKEGQMAQKMIVPSEGLLDVESILGEFLLHSFLNFEKILPVRLFNQRQACKMREEGETADNIFVLEGHELFFMLSQ